MSQNQSMEIARSVPCMNVTSRILDKPDNSMGFFKSCVTDPEREFEKLTEKSRPSVKSLIDKHRLFQNKLMDAKVADFNVKKKSFAIACENLNTSYDCCRNMEGDTQRVDKVENFVKNHMFGIFNAKINEWNDTKKSARVQDHKLVQENFDFKTGMPELDETVNDMGKQLLQIIMSLVNINRYYHRCLTDILDTKKFNNLNSVKNHVGSVLKQGNKAESTGSELITFCQTNLEKIGHVLDSKYKLPIESNNRKCIIYHSRLSVLQNELTEVKKSWKNTEHKIALLEREKRDLLNIKNSYDNENVHKVSLEKRIQAEQKRNVKLRAMMSKIFEQKMPSYIF
ncbi:Hypothetical protein CINCED_3A024559 [Cinara cedri]|uniref:Uncharacterized protein n=1 Tax=Cinara cedri TaxID=506608 RepID=A0A5E4M1V4_9HEMI|nr:Hypothetical protein CINCED_3A024559 [Cinara cedri]